MWAKRMVGGGPRHHPSVSNKNTVFVIYCPTGDAVFQIGGTIAIKL
jgi:hypothetical protein